MDKIKDILPHRYPFLLVDKIIEVKAREYAIGIKNVSYNEPFFQGHFPDNNIFPGALLLEALAQMTGIMYAYTEEENKIVRDKIGYLAGVKSLRFYQLIRPGDQVVLKSEYISGFENIIEVKITAYVEDKLVAKGVILVTQNVE